MAGGERVARYEIGLGGDDAEIRSLMTGLRTQFKSVVADLEATTRNVKLFEGLETKTKASADALATATANAKKLADELDKVKAAGGKASDDLTRGLREANKEVAAATREFDRNVVSLSKLQTTLSRAGVDTGNLAAAQTRLAAASRVAADAAAVQASKQALGLVTLRDMKPAIDQLHVAYNTLAASGKLSATELAAAHNLMRGKVGELNAQVTTLGTSTKATGAAFGQAFSFAYAKVLGLVAVIGTLSAAYAKVDKVARDYGDSVARLGTITNLSRAELEKLGKDVQSVAVTVGVDLQQSMSALFELLRTGVPKENAIEAVKITAEAAKLAMVDMNTAATVSGQLVSGFGATVETLAGQFEVLIAGAKDGGATLTEFAAGGGNLLAVAREANVPIQQLVATLTVMVNATGDASGSITNLQKILTQLQTDSVREKLRGLGIDTKDLTQIFVQLADKGIPVDQILELGIGGTRAAASIAALTANASQLNPELERMGKAAEIAKQGLDGLTGSSKERLEKFNAALTQYTLNVGAAVGASSKFATIGTYIVTAINDIQRVQDSFWAGTPGSAQGTIFDNALSRWVAGLFGVPPAAKAATDAMGVLDAASKAAGENIVVTNAKISDAFKDLKNRSAELLKGAQEIQAATVANLALMAKAAADAIAALDRAPVAAADTAVKTLAIQKKLAEEQLEALKKNEKEVTEATEKAIEARIAALRREGKTDAEITGETARTRTAYLGQILAGYQKHYDGLLALNQGYQDKLRQSEQDRVAFNEVVEKILFNLRLSGLSALDQYLAKVQEIEKLIALSREVGATEGAKAAKKYTDEAIALAQTLQKASSVSGAEIISGNQAQAKSVELIKKAADGYNASLGEQGAAAKTGADETQREIRKVLPILEQMRDLVTEVNKTVAQGVKLGVELDSASIAAAQQVIADLTKPRTVTVTVQTVTGNAAGGFIGRSAQALSGGGSVGQAVQRFAGGGGVFRRMQGAKVPGSGNADTHPAMLSVGSFVTRKSASEHYGDSIMTRLAQMFAGGGSVGAISSQIFGGSAIISRILSGPGLGEGQNLGVNQATVKALENFKTARYVAEYAQEVLRRFGQTGAGRELLGYLGASVAGRIRFVQEHPSNTGAIDALLAEASYIGANLPLVAFKDRTSGVGAVTPPFSFADFVAALQSGFGFAAGGPVGDTVPAMLTPGEYVLSPHAVANVSRRFGGGFLEALNARMVPKGFLDGMMNLAPPRPPLRFADGGPVPGGPPSPPGPVRMAGGPLVGELHLHGTPADFASVANVRRFIVPALREIERRGRE